MSQTALTVKSDADVCDQGRYLDALSFNAIVLPRQTTWRSQGTVTDGGDLVAVLDANTGNLAVALVGDRGPAASICKGSVALAAALGGATLSKQQTAKLRTTAIRSSGRSQLSNARNRLLSQAVSGTSSLMRSRVAAWRSVPNVSHFNIVP